ncbi:MAG: tRNA epoxyqueuosine(34) reductase QueG [Candidatus Poribacteria bacterium]|nr:tRNA epoxyqueuosine(34) reductase QueG [Candidatus Poribacteria bacterium]
MYANLTAQIRAQAQKIGFELVGIIPAEPSKTIDLYERWLQNGYAGEMDYLERHLPLKRDPRELLPEAKSLIALAINYYTLDPSQALTNDPSRGQISRYAWGTDYHDIIHAKLRQLTRFIQKIAQEAVKTRVFVDAAPVLEREYAQAAGIGWIAKNTNVINWQAGSWFFLAGILVSIELGDDLLPPRGSCGTCTRCIEACPTDAILAPNVLDSRLCISYLTIELKGSIPRALRPQMGNLIFGCDICQEVCPWNSKATPTQERGFYPRKGNLAPKLLSLINMTQEEFSKRFKESPIKRAKRRGFLRNVAVALGNWKHPSAVIPLKKAMEDDEPLVRGHAAWALGQIGGKAARKALQARLKVETHPEVISEIKEAMREAQIKS